MYLDLFLFFLIVIVKCYEENNLNIIDVIILYFVFKDFIMNDEYFIKF